MRSVGREPGRFASSIVSAVAVSRSRSGGKGSLKLMSWEESVLLSMLVMRTLGRLDGDEESVCEGVAKPEAEGVP